MTAEWRSAVCVEVRRETATASSVRLRLEGDAGLDSPATPGVVAGQHIDIRLTAGDGYQAVRSYSLAAIPSAGPFGRPLGRDEIEIAVERLPTGEVSPYLVDDFEPGDPVEVRGPVGGWFVWSPNDEGPVQLLGGGSGVAPLVAMLRSRVASGSTSDFRLLYSVRSPEAVYFADELATFGRLPGIEVTTLFTRSAPGGWPRPAGRLDAGDVRSLDRDPAGSPTVDGSPTVYICGPNSFVSAATDLLLEAGRSAADIRTERFGGV